MQGPRLSSHYDRSINLPVLLPIESVENDKLPRSNPDSTPPSSDRIDSRHDRCGLEESADEGRSRESRESIEERGGDQGGRRANETRWETLKRIVTRHGAFVGPGILAAVAYIDPGNWATDLQAGSQYGYSHLFVVLLAGFIALLFQLLSARLGIVTGMDLASHCRASLYDRPKHKMFYRWGVLYPLYALSELGIIFTDMAELLGSAIAINLLIPQIPLPVCVVLTSLDVLLILGLFNQYPTRTLSRSMRIFEALIAAFVFVVLGSYIALLVRVEPVWADVFQGYVPGSGMIDNGGLFIAIGILGATVMPHSFYLGSKIATVHRVTSEAYAEDYESEVTKVNQTLVSPPRPRAATQSSFLGIVRSLSLGTIKISNRRKAKVITADSNGNELTSDAALTDKDTDLSSSSSSTMDSHIDLPRSVACVRTHLAHAQIDITISLLGFAVVINSAILIVASAVFYYGTAIPSTSNVTDLFDAFDLFKTYIGPAFAYIFAIGLFAAGQAASLTVTLAGQIVSEGFIRWNTTPWKRRLITRAIGIVPSLAVALAVGRNGIDALLVGSQVALSFVLPFVITPLLIFTTNRLLMSVPIDLDSEAETPLAKVETHQSSSAIACSLAITPRSRLQRFVSFAKTINPIRRRMTADGRVGFANPVLIVWFGWTFFAVITLSNILAVYQLATS